MKKAIAVWKAEGSCLIVSGLLGVGIFSQVERRNNKDVIFSVVDVETSLGTLKLLNSQVEVSKGLKIKNF